MRKDTLFKKVNDTTNLVQVFKTNEESILKKIYQENYTKIEFYILKNNGSQQQAKDIYQEAFFALWKNIKSEKFKPTSQSALNGYLYKIAKNKWIDYLRSSAYKKMIPISKLNNLDINQFSDEIIEDQNNDKINIAMKAFKSLGDSCRTLLKMVYFEKKSMKEIAVVLQLDTASTRNKKYRCMQKLRELALNKSK